MAGWNNSDGSPGARASRNCARGTGRRDERGRLQQRRKDGADLVRPAARQQRHDRPARLQADAAKERLAPFGRPRELHERVADEGGGGPRRAVDLRLEGEDHEDAVRDRPERAHAPASPRPELRRDVVDERDALAAQGGREPEVEIREVDHDGDVGADGTCGPHQAPVHLERARQHAHRLGEAGDRQPAVVPHQLAARRLEPVAPEPENPNVRGDRAERLRQGARIQVARRFAARHQDGGGHYRVLRRSTDRRSS